MNPFRVAACCRDKTTDVWFGLALLGAGHGACAYPRRTTGLTPVAGASTADAPPALYRLFVEGAQVPPRQRSGLSWDDEGGPDPYVRVVREDSVLFETEPATDTLSPTFDAECPGNVRLASESLRFELWDADDGSDDPIGIWQGQGLPASTVVGARTRLRTDTVAEIFVRIEEPIAHRGTGILSYEVRGDGFEVVEVAPFSPAGRAGVRAGDRVVAVGGQLLHTASEADGASRLSLAVERNDSLTIRRDGLQREVALDQGYVWLVR